MCSFAKGDAAKIKNAQQAATTKPTYAHMAIRILMLSLLRPVFLVKDYTPKLSWLLPG
jgi:hypothetical protein